MKLPAGKTEQEVLETVENVVNRLVRKFRNNYLTADDIKQEGWLEALKVLELEIYNPVLPLENFLYIHVRNRLYNYRRGIYKTHEIPCITCPFYDPKFKKSENQCLAFINKNDCDKWVDWQNKSFTKQSLIEPLNIANINDEDEDGMKINFDLLDDIDKKDMFEKIDSKLDFSLRADWLRLKTGLSLPKNRKQKVIEEVRRILGICLENADL